MTMTAMPADSYTFGSHYMVMIAPVLIVVTLFVNYGVLPIFYNNNIDNCYAVSYIEINIIIITNCILFTQYLELRFSKSVRNLITIVFFVLVALTLPITSFIPALAFSQSKI